MDRKLLKLPFRLKNPPDWECPTCGKGILRVKQDTFIKNELSYSKAAHNEEAWEPEWIEYTYSCVLECTNDKCKEVVSSVGTGTVDWEVEYGHEGIPEQVYYDLFRPTYFEPHLSLIPIPETCPDSVAAPLRESFKLFFSSPSAASNNVRISVEELLTELKIKRFNTVNGQRRFINLHQRIALLPSKYTQYKDILLAIKWLGNAGSHGGREITTDDVLDAYELIAHILQEIYLPRASEIKKLAKRVNKSKGPARKK